MNIFEDVEELEAWLKPMSYTEFWEAVEDYDLRLQDRDHCDDLIMSGEVDQALILSGLKIMARVELTLKLELKYRYYEPATAQYVYRVH